MNFVVLCAVFCACVAFGCMGITLAFGRRLRRTRGHLHRADVEAAIVVGILAKWPESWDAPLRAAKRLESVRRALADAGAALNEQERRDPCHESENPRS